MTENKHEALPLSALVFIEVLFVFVSDLFIFLCKPFPPGMNEVYLILIHTHTLW